MAHLRSFLDKEHAKDDAVGAQCKGEWEAGAKEIMKTGNWLEHMQACADIEPGRTTIGSIRTKDEQGTILLNLSFSGLRARLLNPL